MIDQVIAYFLKFNKYDDPEDYDVIHCYEMSEWIDETCDYQEINTFAKRYVDFTQMLLDDDESELYTRIRKDDGEYEIRELYDWVGEEGNVWNGRVAEYIKTAPANTIFAVRTN
jgi:disulfide oxidoreductase YuzD